MAIVGLHPGWLLALALVDQTAPSGRGVSQPLPPPPVNQPALPKPLPYRGGTSLSESDGSRASPSGSPPATEPVRMPAGTVARTEHPSPDPRQPSVTSGVGLTTLIGMALESNPDLRSASERVQIADATLARARAEFFPTLSVAEAFLDTNIAGLAFFLEVNQRRFSLNQNVNNPGFVNNFSTFVTLQQNVYAGGRRSAEVLSAEEQRAGARFALEAARNELVYRVAEAFYRLLQARDLVASRSAAVHQVERHLDLVRSRYENGTAVRSDVLTVEVRQAEVREGLITASNQLELAWAVLENVTGCRLPHVLPERDEPAPWSGHVGAVEAAIAEAVAQRPELGTSLSETRGAAHDVEATRAGKRPRVDFIGNFSTFDINAGSGGNGLFVGLIASVNLFDGHRTKAQVSRASARVRELQARHQRLLMDIELEVRRAYLALQDAEGRLQVAGRAIAQANESVREIENRYEDQKATITQLVDAQVAATNARIRRSNAAAEVEIARAGLERVVGRLTQILAQ